jgi:quercetin dioxygenase-like cupin family protein
MRVRYILSLASACILTIGHSVIRTGAAAQSVSNTGATPLILEKEDGEHRVRRPREIPVPTGAFTIKVDQLNGGSKNLVLGTESLAPGGTIPRHKHIGQDEIVLIETGTAHVWLGDQEQEVHAGAAVFIPAETWVSIKNSGNENINLVFVFSAPGFEAYLRCTSVREGDKTSPMTGEQWRACQHAGHISFEAAPQSTTSSSGSGSSPASN